jgi:hypothetical protein
MWALLIALVGNVALFAGLVPLVRVGCGRSPH